ncbi:tolA protein [Bdellovibrio sp. NC01]|nr:tolA protein [Bdellovibrio sp. NC01]
MILIFSYSVANAASDLELLYSKQIAWAAANMDDPKVVASFKTSFQKLVADKSKVSQLQTPEGKIILQQGQNLLTATDLKARLDKCVVSTAAAKGVAEALAKALNIKALSPADCFEPVAQEKKLQLFGKDLQQSMQDDAKEKILGIASQQLKNTQKYWQQAASQDTLDVAVELMDRERDLKARPAQQGLELLFYTNAIKDRKFKSAISQVDVKNAFKEVQGELKKHEDYLTDLSRKSSEESLQNLVISNPAATAEYLLKNPGSADLICKILQGYDSKVGRQETIDKAVFWGGLVVGGVLLVTGIGAGVGAVVLSGTAAATTLTTVATGVAIAGTVVGGGETVYASSKAYSSFVDASNLRSSAYAEGLSGDAFTKADQAKKQAYSELAEAGFSAVSIIPFGTGMKVMKEAAQASRLGSLSKVATEGAKVEAASVKSLAVSLKEVSADKEVLKALEKSQKEVSSDEMGMFLGYLSDLPANERQQVLTMIKQKPEKVSQAIRESSTAGVCK